MRACSGCLRQRQCRPAPTPAAAAATTDLPWHGLQRTRDACFAKPLTPTLVPPSTAHIHPSRSPIDTHNNHHHHHHRALLAGHSAHFSRWCFCAAITHTQLMGGQSHTKIAVAGVVSTAGTHQESAGQPVLGNRSAAPGLANTPTASTGPTGRNHCQTSVSRWC